MPLECKKYHGKCAARCCGVVPIPRTIWQRNQHNIQREVVSAHKCLAGKDEASQVTAILPFTEDLLCPFLKPDLSCAIYDERPEVCRKFGDETHIMMCCPMQKADGNQEVKMSNENTTSEPTPILLQVGDVVQIDPEHDKVFGGSFMIVTEPKEWGAQGYVQIPGQGQAYYRCKHENMVYIGKCEWIRE